MSRLVLVMALAAATPASAMPPAIYIVRHFEKDPLQGDGGLTAKGRAHAACFARALAGKPIAIVYHSELKRGAETAALLAKAMPGAVLESYSFANQAALVVRVRAEDRPVLIVSHREKISGLIAALGGTAPPEPQGYGDLWTITTAQHATTRDNPMTSLGCG